MVLGDGKYGRKCTLIHIDDQVAARKEQEHFEIESTHNHISRILPGKL